jgi:hypothetical protein
VASGVTERRRTTHIFYEKRVPEDQLVKPLWFDDDVAREGSFVTRAGFLGSSV